MSRIIRLRKLIINALLTREEVNAAAIAKEIGCEPSSANTVIRGLTKYLAQRRAPEEPGRNRIYFSAVDRDGLIRERDMKRTGSSPQAVVTNRMSFDALLSAWNISMPLGCDLPSTIHQINMEDDQLFEEAA